MRYLTSRDVRRLLSMGDVIEAVERAYELLGGGQVNDVPRANVGHASLDGNLKSLQAAAPIGLGGILYSGGFGGSADPTKLTVLFDPDTGGLRCLVESDALSWLRTGATSGVATRHLARPDSSTAGIVGSGKQARSQLLAVDQVLDLDRALVYSPDRGHRERFAEELSASLGLDVSAEGSPETVVGASDVVCTATTSSTPVFEGGWLEPGTHVNAIGAHYPNQREVDSAAVERSRVVVDSERRARAEEGEVLIPIGEGRLAWDEVTELGDVVAGTAAVRREGAEITLMTSGALSIEYLAVAEAAARRAEAADVGRRLPVETGYDLTRP